VSSGIVVVIGVVCFIVGGVVAFFARQKIAAKQIHTAEESAKKILAEAQERKKSLILEARDEALKTKAEAESAYHQHRAELSRMEKRLNQKEENLERKGETMESRERSWEQKERELAKLRGQLEEIALKQREQLEMISEMSSAEARDFLLQKVDTEIQDEIARRIYEMENQLKTVSHERAQRILAETIQRCAAETVSEATVSVVPLPNDEIKGRIIGREGRNIRAFEHATGVELLIDDTPEVVTISCFEPVRREAATLALNRLILDGRIHPARIEEVVSKAQEEVETLIQREGEQAASKVGVSGLHPELIKLLGRLKYRFSYGQNVLQHSIEVAQLAGMMASEIGTEADLAKRAGLLHDIGKAAGSEVEGPHALIGANIAKQYEKSPRVIQGIAEHHGENGITTIEGFLVSAADAISGARPGARREQVEQYLKRLQALEEIANSFSGVEKSYAIQAGREVRILVKPGEIDDIGAAKLSHDIAKKIEEDLSYPGQVKVTVVRETRAVNYAK
jgi:ribonuclease Y